MRTYLTAELSRGDIERITAAVKTRLQECGVDLLDVAVYRVAAAVNERLEKTLTTTAAGDVRIQTAHDELYRAQQRITELQNQLAAADRERAELKDAIAKIGSPSSLRLAHFIRDNVPLTEEEMHLKYPDIAIRVIRDLQKRLAQKHDDCVTGEAATAMKLERERLGEQIDRLARCLRDVTGEFRPTEGTCNAAIRVIGEQNARIIELREQLGSARARFDAYREVVSLRTKDKP